MEMRRDNYRPQRSCGQGSIFTPVCHSVQSGGVCGAGWVCLVWGRGVVSGPGGVCGAGGVPGLGGCLVGGVVVWEGCLVWGVVLGGCLVGGLPPTNFFSFFWILGGGFWIFFKKFFLGFFF